MKFKRNNGTVWKLIKFYFIFLTLVMQFVSCSFHGSHVQTHSRILSSPHGRSSIPKPPPMPIKIQSKLNHSHNRSSVPTPPPLPTHLKKDGNKSSDYPTLEEINKHQGNNHSQNNLLNNNNHSNFPTLAEINGNKPIDSHHSSSINPASGLQKPQEPSSTNFIQNLKEGFKSKLGDTIKEQASKSFVDTIVESIKSFFKRIFTF
jgi:hypothetical protein